MQSVEFLCFFQKIKSQKHSTITLFIKFILQYKLIFLFPFHNIFPQTGDVL